MGVEGQVPKVQGNDLAGRRPRMRSRPPGPALRYAARTRLASLLQLPPRYTRQEPLVGPVGSVASDEYWPCPPCVHSNTLPSMSYSPAVVGVRTGVDTRGTGLSISAELARRPQAVGIVVLWARLTFCTRRGTCSLPLDRMKVAPRHERSAAERAGFTATVDQ